MVNLGIRRKSFDFHYSLAIASENIIVEYFDKKVKVEELFMVDFEKELDENLKVFVAHLLRK